MAASALALALGLAGCAVEAVGSSTTVDLALLAFERSYSDSLAYESQGGVKMIGFKTISIPKDAVEEFDAMYAKNRSTLKNYRFDRSSGILRVYFPVESALVELDGGVIEANALGELAVRPDEPALRTMAVIGRQQTATVRGVKGNVIRDGIIYLAQKKQPDHVSGRLYVFDFGIKVITDEHDHETGAAAGSVGSSRSAITVTVDGGSSPDLGTSPDMASPRDMASPPDMASAPDGGASDMADTPCPVETASGTLSSGSVGYTTAALAECGHAKVGCIANHGGVNCSTAFGIFAGRCPFNPAVCMDYNGWFTDCVRAGGARKFINFPGSDCDWALGAGHCWNEIM